MKTLTIYTSPTCAPCHMVKQYLKLKGVAYIEVDRASERFSEAMSATGMAIVPQVTDGNTWLTGYNPSSLAKLVEVV